MRNPDETKKHLANVMLQLSRKHSFDKISVADISKEGEINRRTFYYHFIDKYDLLAWYLNDQVLQYLKGSPPSSYWDHYNALAACINAERTFFLNVFEGKDRRFLEQLIKQYIHEHMEQYLPPENVRNTVRPQYEEYLDFNCTKMLACLEDWVLNWPKLSPDSFKEVSRFDRYF